MVSQPPTGNEDMRVAELIDHARAQWREDALSTMFQQPRYRGNSENFSLAYSKQTMTKVSEVSKGKAKEKSGRAAPVGYRHLDSTTTPFFFSNIPDGALTTDLWRMFIPNKLDRWGHRFGFVKFLEVKDEEALGARLEDVWLRNTHLKVNMARFGRESSKMEVLKKKEVVGGSSAGPSVLPGKTYKTVVRRNIVSIQKVTALCMKCVFETPKAALFMQVLHILKAANSPVKAEAYGLLCTLLRLKDKNYQNVLKEVDCRQVLEAIKSTSRIKMSWVLSL